MSPLLNSGSYGLRPVRNPLIRGALQQRGKKLLVESDSDNRAGPPPDWGPPRGRTGQLLKVVTSLSFVSPGLDLLVAHATSVEKALTHGNIVYETRSRSLSLYRNTRQPSTITERDEDPALRRAIVASGLPPAADLVDPQATTCWPANLQPQVKNCFKMRSLIGRSSGESFQLACHGQGFVVVQPSERQPVMTWS